jgi:hypothetical protein
METLVEFLKHSTTVDLLVIVLVLLSVVILIPVGILIVIVARRRLPIYFFLIASVLPLLLALLGTYLRFRGIERALSLNPYASSEVVAAAHQEAWITTYLGAAATAVLELIGVMGLLLKKDRKA